MVAANLNAQINILKMTEQIFSICFGVIMIKFNEKSFSFK
jgi:hypothetical protein